MPYHTGLTRAQGDPGFFGFLGKLGGTILRAAPGPIGTIAKTVGLPTFGGTKQPSVATPGFVGPRRPTGKTVATIKDDGTVCPRRRRRIDPLNIKALRRANTRQRAFLRAVDSTLKGMPTKSSVSSRRRKIAGATRKRR